MRTILLILLALVYGCLTTEPTGVEVMNLSNGALENCENFDYSASVIMRIPSGDSISFTGECWLKKMPSDTLFGYYMRIIQSTRKVQMGDRKHSQKGIVEHLYTGASIYYTQHSSRNITTRPPVNAGGFISVSTARNYIPQDIIVGYTMDKVAVSPDQVSLDSIANDYWVLRIESDLKNEFVERFKLIWINKKTYLPFKFFHKTERSVGDIWTTKVSLANLKVNINSTVVDSILSELSVPQDYEVKNLSPPGKDHKWPSLGIGIPAPSFSLLTNYGDSISFSDLKGKMLLLDFWYINCYPCRKAIPTLNNIKSRYEEKGLEVLGMNPYDRKKERMDDYLSRKKVSYTIVEADSQIIADYKIKSYPTFYLIDRKGNIRFSEIGFLEGSLDSLEAIIQSELLP